MDGLRLLVVEDNAINQQVASELLSAEGAMVQIAENGAIAVAAIAGAQSPFDVVLMDLQMPVMDGYSAAKRIRETIGPEVLPIIAMTANAMASDRAACLAAGMNDHVGKPFDLENLVNVLLHYTGRTGTVAVHAQTDVATNATPAAEQVLATDSTDNGFDMQGALDRMGGHRDLYERVLRQYVGSMADIAGALDQRLAAGDRAGAAALLHTLKGLSATVGAVDLAGLSTKAENALKNADTPLDGTTWQSDLHMAMDATRRNAQVLLQAFTGVAAAHGPADSATLDREQLQRDLTQLQQLLRQSDMQALALHSQLLQAHGPSMGHALDALNRAIETLDFASATTACEQLLLSDG